MTICVGALAANSAAIVCVADKAVNYGGYLQWDSDSAKIVGFADSPNVGAMIAGGEGPIGRLCLKLAAESGIGNSRSATLALCEEKFKAVRDELIDIRYLGVNLLSRSDFINRR